MLFLLTASRRVRFVLAAHISMELPHANSMQKRHELKLVALRILRYFLP